VIGSALEGVGEWMKCGLEDCDLRGEEYGGIPLIGKGKSKKHKIPDADSSRKEEKKP